MDQWRSKIVKQTVVLTWECNKAHTNIGPERFVKRNEQRKGKIFRNIHIVLQLMLAFLFYTNHRTLYYSRYGALIVHSQALAQTE